MRAGSRGALRQEARSSAKTARVRVMIVSRKWPGNDLTLIFRARARARARALGERLVTDGVGVALDEGGRALADRGDLQRVHVRGAAGLGRVDVDPVLGARLQGERGGGG